MSLEGSDFDTVLAVYTGAAVNTLTLVGRNDQCTLEGVAYSISCLAFPITTGTTYSLQVDGYASSRGHVEVYLDFSDSITPPGNDAFSAAASIMSLPTMGTTLGATMESGEPQAGLGASGSVWVRFTAPVASTTAQARCVGLWHHRVILCFALPSSHFKVTSTELTHTSGQVAFVDSFS